MTKIAIIGAGLSGLTAAHFLRDDADITIFEKSRSVGGRMSTRRAEPYFFDHGAQYFTAKTKPFQAFIQPLLDQDIIERAGKTWRLKAGSPSLAESAPIAGQLASLVNNWTEALVKRQNVISKAEFSSPDHVVVLWLAGERNGRVISTMKYEQQTYILYNDDVFLLDFPTIQQLTQW